MFRLTETQCLLGHARTYFCWTILILSCVIFGGNQPTFYCELHDTIKCNYSVCTKEIRKLNHLYTDYGYYHNKMSSRTELRVESLMTLRLWKFSAHILSSLRRPSLNWEASFSPHSYSKQWPVFHSCHQSMFIYVFDM